MIHLRLVLLLVIALIPNGILTIFEDQAGTYDWRHEYVGRPIFSHIDTTLSRLYVATDQNALACINLKKGNIVWRKVFEANLNGKIDRVVWARKEIVVISSGGQRIQSYDYVHGAAGWDYNLFVQDPSKSKAKLSVIESKQQSEAFYASNGHQLCSLTARDKICVELPTEGGYLYENLIETEQGVFVIGTRDNTIQRLQYNFQLNTIVSKQSDENGQFKYENCVKSWDSNELACFSLQNEKIQIFEMKTGSSGTKLDSKHFALKSTLVDNNPTARLEWSSKDTLIVTTTNDQSSKNIYVLRRPPSGENELILMKPISSVSSFDVINRESGDLLVYSDLIPAVGNKKRNVHTIDLKSMQEKPEHSFGITSENHLDDQRVVINIKSQLSDAGAKSQMTTLCFFNDYSMSVYGGGAQNVRYFVREEALAYISSVEMIDLPLTHLQEEFEDEFGSDEQTSNQKGSSNLQHQSENLLVMFYKRIRTQLVQLKEFLTIDLVQKINSYLADGPIKTTGSSSSISSSSSQSSSSVSDVSRDSFNLNKLIVAATTVGKVFGIYTGSDGKVLWSFYLPDSAPFHVSRGKNPETVLLFVQRTPAHVPHEPQCAIITKLKSNGKSRVFYFNPLTGQVAKDQPKQGVLLDYQVKQAFLANAIDTHYLKPLILFDSEKRLHVLPEKAIDDVKAKFNKPTVIYSTSEETDKDSFLVGYLMRFDNEPLKEVWRVNLDDEKIIAIGAKPTNDRVHSYGKVLGDRSVLYKYLNPNLVGVVTSGQDSQKVPFVNVYLIDTVTGSIVSSFNHKRCRGPVHIVHTEDWFFYSYYNVKFRRFEVTTIELFEGSTQFNASHFSSLDDIKPVVYSKSYIVLKSFDAIQITQTEKGISTKDIIVATPSGMIIEIPWLLLDPRRPLKMTEVEREEALIPYMPEIPLNYEFSLNYYNYVFNIRGIATAPSGLESTSLVFAYGLDLFYTRVFPSRTFDMLREDFDYFFIITLMVGLLLGTLISKKLASSSILKKAWK